VRPPGDYPLKGRRPAVKKRNVRIAAEHGCILTGRSDGIDPAHVPYRRSHGAGWGLLEFVPLARSWHTRYDAGDPLAIALVSISALGYYRRVLRRYPHEYLGPDWLIEEVTSGKLVG